MKQLIITADDFGAAHEVNEAVEIAHRRGILTAASLMVGAPAVDEAVAIARRNPKLGVGLHLVLVEGRPVLPLREVGGLVDDSGHFRTDMVSAGAKMFFLPRVKMQLKAEIEAQFAAFAATGLKLDHVNAHKHFHLHPTIIDYMLKTGARYGLKAVRMPLEPTGPMSTDGAVAGSPLLNWWISAMRRRVIESAALVPDQVFGLRWSGGMTEERLSGIIENLPQGLSEIYLHPATGAYAGSAPGYRYADELAALISQAVLAAAHSPDVQLGSFADFLNARAPVNSGTAERMQGSTSA